ncbi:Asp23/Gls24 family envelope stress response protein [Tepidibacter aestuarii]|uniref:Asp23/Gls24 family envelope stress response protein n=1 Tax=Tepidibacter aestuarii TaxID=2925782 RepID=UPI0020C0AA04|nr:Asp23/Gls24 family envelope stress response protein [Tepidibacter aestuarii]CAH2212849.1 putative factor involved in malonyl-CoA synthesis [Tepidibacter aestuarii]
MSGTIANKYGNIYIDKEVIAKIASQVSTECYGIVGFSYKSKVDGIVELLKKENMSNGVKVEIEEDTVSIELFVIIQYGTKISVVADNIIDRVKYTVEKMTSLKVRKIDINVQGVRVNK